jgi:Fic-DOC domain mobile mystery protein B
MTKLFNQPAGASPISDEQAEGLKQTWVSTQEDLNAVEEKNFSRGRDWLFKSKREANDISRIEFLCTLHKKMLGEVYSWAGEIRRNQTNIGIESHQIRTSVENLRRDLLSWIDNQSHTEEEIAIKYHFRLVQIHPFLNGNGRLSRFLADFLNEKYFENEPFSWGRKNLILKGEARSSYLRALKDADQENLMPLIEFARS